jgi:casein kinase I homolog HRR25
LYFLRGGLPWQELKGETKQEKYKLMMEKKATISVDELCDDVPREFAIYMDHVRTLKFDGKPKYAYLRKIFWDLFIRNGFEYDNVFDWTIKRYLELDRPQKEPSA